MRISAALLIVAVVIVVLSGLLAPQGGGASWEDDGVHGHSDLADRLSRSSEVRVIGSSLSLLPTTAGGGDVLFLFPTHRPASTTEVAQVQRFVEQGGLLVIAADGANAATWSKGFGVNFKGLPVSLPPGEEAECVATDIPWRGTTHAVCLPGPTAFPDLDELTERNIRFDEVSYTTIPVYIDIDGEGQIDAGDQAARVPVGVQWSHGDQGGHVVAIADGDVWRNHIVREEAGNLELAAAFADAASQGTVYLDNSGSQSTLQERTQNTWYRVASAPDTREQAMLSLFFVVFATGAVLAPRVKRLLPHDPPSHSEDPDVRERALTALAQNELEAASPSVVGGRNGKNRRPPKVSDTRKGR